MSDDICNGAVWGCGETRNAIVGWTVDQGHSQVKDRIFAMVIGSHEIPVNIRNRQYAYADHLNVDRTDFRYIYGTVVQNYIAECFNQVEQTESTITEDYTATDCKLYHVDLRYDSVTYMQSTQTMKYEAASNQRIHARTSYDDALFYPYVLEEVPITITNSIINTNFGELHTETINTGYWNGIRVLMPLFNGNAAPYGKFVYGDVEYDAAVVDWYYLPNHRASDGDEFFWWADWHKSIGINNDIDEQEAIDMWQLLIGSDDEVTRSVSAGLFLAAPFTGSSAVDGSGNMFLSASFEDGALKFSRLTVGGNIIDIPKDCECDVWYPVAPI